MTKPDERNIVDRTALARASQVSIARGARLVVVSGVDRGAERLIPSGRCVIGKDADCELRLTDALVSRRHLEVRIVGNGVLVRDLGSRNGSYIFDSRFLEVLVGPGTIIRIGDTTLQVAGATSQTALPPSGASSFGRLLGSSLKMRQVYAVLERVSLTDVPVLIGGETGTGKELCAEAIHQASRVGSGPFVICDAAGIPRSLIESEMFGHVRGAFTGAERNHDGAFVRADNGSLFIDEIGELELAVQPRLLRALEQRQVRPVGGGNYRAVNIRVIAATNRDLREECRVGRFRPDLFHRLSVVEMTLPALRERKEDVPLLVESWLTAREIRASDETMNLLLAHDWPGNVRELRNVIARGVSLLGDAKVLEPQFLGDFQRSSAPARMSGGDYKRAREFHIGPWERDFVRSLLDRNGGNVSLAAREGGLDRTYLHRLMRKHAIKPRSDED